jgi:hypothetical protein
MLRDGMPGRAITNSAAPAVGAIGSRSFATSVSILKMCGLMRMGPSDECNSV